MHIMYVCVCEFMSMDTSVIGEGDAAQGGEDGTVQHFSNGTH